MEPGNPQRELWMINVAPRGAKGPKSSIPPHKIGTKSTPKSTKGKMCGLGVSFFGVFF